MFEKVKGDNGAETHPLYHDLIHSEVNWGEGPELEFRQFLCDKDGMVVKRYSSGSNPADCEPDIKALIDQGTL